MDILIHRHFLCLSYTIHSYLTQSPSMPQTCCPATGRCQERCQAWDNQRSVPLSPYPSLPTRQKVGCCCSQLPFGTFRVVQALLVLIWAGSQLHTLNGSPDRIALFPGDACKRMATIARMASIQFWSGESPGAQSTSYRFRLLLGLLTRL